MLKCTTCGKCKQISKFEAKRICGDFYNMLSFSCDCAMSPNFMASAACLTFIRMDELYIMDEKGKYDEM